MPSAQIAVVFMECLELLINHACDCKRCGTAFEADARRRTLAVSSEFIAMDVQQCYDLKTSGLVLLLFFSVISWQ